MGMYGMECKTAERGLRILFKKSRTQENCAYLKRMIADVVLCVCLICVTGYLGVTLNVSKISERENRKLESFPTILNKNGINKNFSAAVEKYISDHLRDRNKIIDAYSTVLSVFDRRGNKQVFVGENGWLFGKVGGNSHNFSTFLYYQRQVGFTPEQMEKIKADLKRLNDWTIAHGIKLYLYFPPDKQTIYQEYYPRFIEAPDKPTLVAEVEEFLKNEVNIVSLEGEFKKRRRKDYLHYKTESHWTPAGGYLAYRLIMKRLKQDFPTINPLTGKDMDIVKTAEVIGAIELNGRRRSYKGNQYNMLGKPSYIDVHEPIYNKYILKNQKDIQTLSKPPFEISFNPNGQELKVYLITDSYSDYIMPFLSATFKEVRKVRINQRKWGIVFNDRASDVEKFAPDVLLLGISDLKLIELLKIW